MWHDRRANYVTMLNMLQYINVSNKYVVQQIYTMLLNIYLKH